MEQSLGNCAVRIRDLVEEYKSTATGRKKIMPLVNKYYNGRYKDLTVDEFIKLHESKPFEEVYYFNVGSFSSYTPDKVQEIMDELGVESQSTILMPQDSVTDLSELRANLPEEEYNEIVKGMEGKMIPMDKKLQCGPMTMIELYHIPSYSCKVTTSLYGHGVSEKRDEPILGKGKYRVTGQKIGEIRLKLSRNFKNCWKRNQSNQQYIINKLNLLSKFTKDLGL